MAAKTGKLHKGGEPDMNNVSKTIIWDWQRGNLPYFTKAPSAEERKEEFAPVPVPKGGQVEVMAPAIVGDDDEEAKEE